MAGPSGTTPIYGFPFPTPDDTVDVPRDVQALAMSLDGMSSLRPPLVTSLPASPIDGQEVYYLADNTNGIVWHLRYRSASASTSKWEAPGATPLFAEQIPNTQFGGSTYGLVGPSLVAPLAGDYIVRQGATISSAAAAVWRGRISYIGVDADSAEYNGQGAAAGSSSGGSVERTMRRTLVAGTTYTIGARSDTGATVNFERRWLSLQPVRVG